MYSNYLLNREEYGKARFHMGLRACVLVVAALLCCVAIVHGEMLFMLLALLLLALGTRYAVEWRRVRKSQPATLTGETLNLCNADGGWHKIPLERIRGAKSYLMLFAARGYPTWSYHSAFLEITLTDGSVVCTLAKGDPFASPPGEDAVEEIMAAVRIKRNSNAGSAARERDV